MKRHLLFTLLFLAFATTVSFAQTVIWPDENDAQQVKNSQFDGGLNDWTTHGTVDGVANENAIWVWEADGKADRGAYSGGTNASAIASPSIDNGAAVFDSDYYDNGGTGVSGNGPAPAPHIGYLESPEFSLAGYDNVWLKFNQYIRNFASVTTVEYSLDGGNSWEEVQQVNEDLSYNQSTATNSQLLIPMPSTVDNQSSVKIRFVFSPSTSDPRNYYFWIIDDVTLISTPPGDPVILGTWYPSKRFNIPDGQVPTDSFNFVVDIKNVGGTDLVNVLGKIVLENTSTDEVYFSDSTYFDLNYGDTTRLFFDSYLPTNLDTGLYVANYTVYAEDQASEVKKTHKQYFNVGSLEFDSQEGEYNYYNSVYSVSDLSSNGGVSFQGNSSDGAKYDCYNLNYYKMGDWAENSNVEVRLTSVGVQVSDDTDNDYLSYNAYVFIFQLADTLDENLYNFNFADGIEVDGNPSTQLTYKGYGNENLSDVPQGELQIIPILDETEENEFITLTPNSKYFVGSLWPSGTRYYASVDNYYAGYQRFYYYYDGLYQCNSYVYVNSDDTPFGLVSATDYGSFIQPMFLEFKVNSVSTKDQLLDEETFNFDQNPTNDVLKVNINFADYVDHATLVIHDVNGAIIDVRNMYNEKESVQNIKVGTLPAGEYIATLFTNDKLLSKKFVVTK